jgi:hypothetical protein
MYIHINYIYIYAILDTLYIYIILHIYIYIYICIHIITTIICRFYVTHLGSYGLAVAGGEGLGPHGAQP